MTASELKEKEYERRDARLQNAVPMRLTETDKDTTHLRIVYVMAWTAMCGGNKIILEHCNRLAARGHQVTILSHHSKPDWFPLDERVAFMWRDLEQVLGEHIPQCDIIVATYWTEIYECVEHGTAPVVYFEQGVDYLFQPESFNAGLLAHARKQIKLAPFIHTVSTHAAKALSDVFGVSAEVIPNAVDKTVFYPDQTMKRRNGKLAVTTIGSDWAEEKRIIHALDCAKRLRAKGYDFEFIWITPGTPASGTLEPAFINPEQSFIGDCLRRTDIYLSASRFESFCLPVLEAMTCGAAVVATNCGGFNDFVKDGENALVLERDDIALMPQKAELLFNDAGLRSRLSANALKTAENFSWDKTIDRVEEYYRGIARFEPC